jgi:hypothetical protein
LDLRGKKWQEAGEDCIMRISITCTLHQRIIRMIKSRRMRWVGHIMCVEKISNSYKILGRKSGGTRPLGRPRHRWED